MQNRNRIYLPFRSGHVFNVFLFLNGILMFIVGIVNSNATSAHLDIDFMIRGGYILAGLIFSVTSITGSGGEMKQHHALLVFTSTLSTFATLLTIFSVTFNIIQYESISKPILSDIQESFREYDKPAWNKSNPIDADRVMITYKCCGWTVDGIANPTLTGLEYPPTCCGVDISKKCKSKPVKKEHTICTDGSKTHIKKPCSDIANNLYRNDINVLIILSILAIIFALPEIYIASTLSKYVREID